VFERLSNLARQRGEDLNLILTRYAVERLVYRLSVSPHADHFILKGAHLFLIWTGNFLRPTRDADFLGFGESDARHITAVFRDICASADDAGDGIRFLPDTVEAEETRENQGYGGVRVRLEAAVHTARVHVQVDVGFGDAVVPAADDVVFPTLLEDMPAPHVRAYPRYAVVAEKLEAMIRLGIANSRMKDFYDVWLLSRLFDFDGQTLTDAVRATMARRRTPLPAGAPTAFTEEFQQDTQKRGQWQAFVRRSRLSDAPSDLGAAIRDLSGMLLPVLDALRTGTSLPAVWSPGGPWRASAAL
jgi:predicted nucleotidyltransferase component of viral defense system